MTRDRGIPERGRRGDVGGEPPGLSRESRRGVLVICIGRTDRGDDAFGLLVADRLERTVGGPRFVRNAGQADALLEYFGHADRILVVDAVRSGAPAGEVVVLDALDGELPVASQASSHGMGLVEAIELGRVLGTLPAHLVVFGAAGATFELGAAPSPAVVDAVDAVVALILEHASEVD